MKGKFTATLLAAALFLSQLALLDHAFDLSSHEDGGLCELCVLSGNHAQALLQSLPTIEIQPIHNLVGRWQDFLDVRPLTTAFLARAPPPDLLTM